MKKHVVIMMGMILVLAVLTSCGNNSEPAESANQSELAGQDDEGKTAETDEPDKINMTYLTLGSTPADIEKVRAAINEISIAEINVEVEFTILSIPETFSNYSLWISSGEKIDLMCIPFTDLSSYVNSGQLMPMNDLLDNYAPYITDLMDVFPIAEAKTYNGVTYGISPVTLNYGSQGAYIIASEYLDEINLERKPIYTLEDLTDIFAAIKELHPDLYPCNVLGSSVTGGTTLFSYTSEIDVLGATAMSGVIMGMDSTQVVNVFEQEEYRHYLETVRGWYEAGYIMTDAATTDSLNEELIKSGVTIGYFMHNKPEMAADATSTYGTPFEALCLTEPYRAATSPSGVTSWTLPITCQNPEAAMKFLNLVFENTEVMNLFKNGIEGEHYTLSEVEGVIDVIDSNRYGNLPGVYGDRRYELSANQGATRADHEAFTEAAAQKTSVAAGYMYDSSNMTNELVAIQSVFNEYLPSLETGSVSDYLNVYEEFLGKLKSAGIERLIKDNQNQFDSWLAGK